MFLIVDVENHLPLEKCRYAQGKDISNYRMQKQYESCMNEAMILSF